MTRTSYDHLYPLMVLNFLYAFCSCCIHLRHQTDTPYCIVSIVFVVTNLTYNLSFIPTIFSLIVFIIIPMYYSDT